MAHHVGGRFRCRLRPWRRKLFDRPRLRQDFVALVGGRYALRIPQHVTLRNGRPFVGVEDRPPIGSALWNARVYRADWLEVDWARFTGRSKPSLYTRLIFRNSVLSSFWVADPKPPR